MNKQKGSWELAKRLVDLWAEKCMLGADFQKSGLIGKARSFLANNEGFKRDLGCSECIAGFQLFLLGIVPESSESSDYHKSLFIERKYITFRLWPDDKRLLYDLHLDVPGVTTRNECLEKLIPLAKDFELSKKPKRKPCRVGIPKALYDEIERLSKESGHTVTDILLMLARKFKSENGAEVV